MTIHRKNPQARMRLFIFPYAGGAASAFRTWPDHLPADLEVCPVQLPGREKRIREPLFSNLSCLVKSLVPVLRPYMVVPFAFFGHSLGALIGFEMARELRRQGLDGPEHLFVSGRCAPQIPDPEPPLHELPDGRFIEGLRRYNGTPDAVLQHKELMGLLLPILRADFAMSETYTYTSEPPLDCPIIAFGGLEEKLLQPDHLAAWENQSTRTFHLHMFPGDHFFIHDYRDDLLQTISRVVNEVQVGERAGLSVPQEESGQTAKAG